MMGLLPFERLKREILVKREAQTSSEFGCHPDDRKIQELIEYGVINLNKPKGPTSHMTSDYVQKILKVDKAGHGGSLDPAVTGVLPVATGRATRIVQALLTAGKEYVCIMHLHKPVEQKELEKALKDFVGKITQMPPVKSAVVRKEREREVYYLDILEIDGQDVLFRMGSQAGTYVRKLCHDVGKRLKVGAHMAELVRTKAGPFTEKDWVSLQDLEDAHSFWKEDGSEKFLRHCIKPVEFAVQHLPKIWIQDSAIDTVCHGASLNVPGIVKIDSGVDKDDVVAVMSLKDELVALGTSVMTTEQVMTENKGLCVKIDKVFMLPGTYPKQKVNK
jgi:H/ACA ribonucleoprotein complex subunit 4